MKVYSVCSPDQKIDSKINEEFHWIGIYYDETLIEFYYGSRCSSREID